MAIRKARPGTGILTAPATIRSLCSTSSACSSAAPRRVIAKIEWHPGELFPKVGFIVTNLPMEPDWVVRFYNQRGTAEQHLLAHPSIRR